MYFPCESDAKKRDWIKCNFPEIKIIFGSVSKLAEGLALNYNTGRMVEVPSVDLVIISLVGTHSDPMETGHDRRRSKGKSCKIVTAAMEYIYIYIQV